MTPGTSTTISGQATAPKARSEPTAKSLPPLRTETDGPASEGVTGDQEFTVVGVQRVDAGHGVDAGLDRGELRAPARSPAGASSTTACRPK